MKKYFVILVLVLMASTCYGDAGIARYQRTYPHSHSTIEDGGQLNPPFLSVRLAADELMTCALVVTIFDTNRTVIKNNGFSEPTSGNWKAPLAGYYLITATLTGYITTAASMQALRLDVISSGNNVKRLLSNLQPPAAYGVNFVSGAHVVYQNGTTDTIKFDAFIDATSGSCYIQGTGAGYDLTSFTITYLGK